MDMEYSIIRMEECMKASFDWIERKVLGYSLLAMDKLSKGFGIWMSYKRLLELPER